MNNDLSLTTNDELTEADLQAIGQRAQAASPAPWEDFLESDGGLGGESFIRVGGLDNSQEDMYVRRDKLPTSNADYKFIAHARQDVPRLVVEVRRLKEALNTTKELYERIDEVLHYVWDPIGISGVPQARDEYYSYIPRVQEAVLRGDSKQDLAQLLNTITTETMGLKLIDERITRVQSAVDAIFDWIDYLKEKQGSSGESK
jgi:hypothetical protein